MTSNEIIDILESLPNFKQKQMFGCTGLFSNDLAFGLLVGNEIFYRHDSIEIVHSKEYIRYIGVRSGLPVKTNYFSTPSFSDSTKSLLFHANLAIERSAARQQHEHNKKQRSLRSLVNVSRPVRRMLNAVGVCSVDSLVDLGADRTFQLLKNRYGANLCCSIEAMLKTAIKSRQRSNTC